jgi:PmbA protein
MEEIIRQLGQNQSVSDWILKETRTVRRELYLSGGKVESRRTVEAGSVQADVFVDHEHEGKTVRGDAHVDLTIGDARQLIAGAVSEAAMLHNTVFSLSRPEALPQVDLVDPSLLEPGVMDHIVDEINAGLRDDSGARLASAEVFIDDTTEHFRSSAGVNASQRRTTLSVEAIALSPDGEAESIFIARWGSLADAALRGSVQAQANLARESRKAVLPKTGPMAVVISDELALSGLFRPFISHCSGDLKYQGASRAQVGETLLAGTCAGEPMDLCMNPLLPRMTRSTAYQSDGLASNRIPVIEANVVRNILCNQRYGEYLGLPVTGVEGNIEVKPGSRALEKLLAVGGTPVLQVARFSSFGPDPLTGDFVAEIRMGYLFTQDGVFPVKGGSIAGNVFEAFRNASYSRETMRMADYCGPQAIRFEKLRVAGQD